MADAILNASDNGCKAVKIYALVDPENGLMRYVGQTRQRYLCTRLAQHWLARGSTPKSEWIRAIKAKGLRIRIIMLDQVSIDDAVRAEREWIRKLSAEGNHLLNVYDPDLSLPRPEESKAKISKFRSSCVGWKHSEETKKKIGRSGAENWNFGRTTPKETREKLSAALRNNKNALGYKHSEETRAKVAAAGIGRKHSEETKRKIAAGNTGKVFSEETRKKMSMAAKARADRGKRGDSQ